MNNNQLTIARIDRKDEFYTLMEDIEKELVFYKDCFEDKIIYCNCDNPDESNFYRYFKNHFVDLKLKKLICSCYISNKDSFYCIYDGYNESRYKFEDDLFYTNGDFRSQECIKLLKSADIVVTNPPFSLFREFISLITKHDKKFIVLGTINAVTYKEVFSLLKENKMTLGVTGKGKNIEFLVPDTYPISTSSYRVGENGEKYIGVKGIRWFTNIDLKIDKEPLQLEKHYSPEDYPVYDNYNAIEVKHIKDIPMDYDGLMGVPITFLDVYNPEQFEIIGITRRYTTDKNIRTKIYTKEEYPNYGDLNAAPVINENGVLKIKYVRLLIRRKNAK